MHPMNTRGTSLIKQKAVRLILGESDSFAFYNSI